MGIGIDQIIEQLEDLIAALDYWKTCQPHRFSQKLLESSEHLLADARQVKLDNEKR